MTLPLQPISKHPPTFSLKPRIRLGDVEREEAAHQGLGCFAAGAEGQE